MLLIFWRRWAILYIGNLYNFSKVMISVINYSSGIDTIFSGVCSMKNTVALYYYFCGTQTIFGCKFPMTFLRALITQEPIKPERAAVYYHCYWRMQYYKRTASAEMMFVCRLLPTKRHWLIRWRYIICYLKINNACCIAWETKFCLVFDWVPALDAM